MPRRALLFLALFVFLPQFAEAIAIPPCTEAGGMDIIPLSNGTGTYCVSDYGWTDTWFVNSAPPVYDPRFDVFSGDDSPNLHFGILGGAPWEAVSGFGWLSPLMDAGFLMPVFPTGSVWEVVDAVHFTGALSTESTIAHPAGMEARIVTMIDPFTQEITQTFTFTNTTTDTTFNDIRFADYFNYHPNGSTDLNAQKGSVSYDPLTGITITGIDDGTLIATGNMRGERLDDAHGRNTGFLGSPIMVLDMVQTDTYFDPGPFPVGPGDVAGALAWDLPNLAPGESVSFTVFKNSEPVPTPEPGSILLLLPGLGLVISTSLRLRGRASSGLRRNFPSPRQ